MLRSRLATITTGVVIGAVVAGGISYAAIPHSKTKQITACILKSGANKGATRIIDAQRGAVCRSTETEIAWSATGVNWRGNWNQTAAYEINDVVYYEGTSWRARTGSINIEPGTSPANWTYLARVGAEGPEGPQGPAGQDGTDATLDRPGHVSTNVDDPVEGAGTYAGIAIGVDGLAVIAHRAGNGLRVTHCDDVACASATSTTVDDPGGIVAYYLDLTIGSDGLPIIAHQNFNTGSLRVTHCDDVACTSATSTDVVSGGGTGPSITIGADGMPIIAHRSGTNLRVSHCDDLACTSATSTTIDNPGNLVGNNAMITLGADGLAVIAHEDFTAGTLRVSHCDDVECTSATNTTVDDPAILVGGHASITIGADGLPIIAHRDFTAKALRVSHCDDVECTSATNTTVDDPANQVGEHTSITIGSDGLPIIAHQDDTAGALRITHCNDSLCSSATSTSADAAATTVGDYASMAVGSDGLPIIAHQIVGIQALRVTHCSNRFCLPYHRAR